MIQKYEEDEQLAQLYYTNQEQIEDWTRGRLYLRGIYNEDTMQDALYYICHALKHNYDSKIYPFNAFLNVCLDRFCGRYLITMGRQKRKGIEVSLDSYIYNFVSDPRSMEAECRIINQMVVDKLLEMVRENYSEKHYMMFCLYINSLTHKEIAGIFNVTTQAVQQRITKIKNFLKNNQKIEKNIHK